MVNYLKKFHSKQLTSFFRFVILSVVLLLFSVFCVNFFLKFSHDAIQEYVSRYFTQKVSVEQVYFIPFNVVVLKNVASSIENIPEGEWDFSAEKVITRFSLKHFFMNRIFVPTKVDLINPYWVCERKMRRSYARINEIDKMFTMASTQHPLCVTVKNGLLNIPRAEEYHLLIGMNTSFKKSAGNSLSGFGSLFFKTVDGNDFTKRDGVKFERGPLQYRFSARLKAGKILLENMEIKKEHFYAKLWGEHQKNELRVNGFISSNNYFWDYHSVSSLSAVWERARKFIFMIAKSPSHNISGSGSGFNLFNLDCVVEFCDESIVLEYARFSLNNIPFCIQGNISFSKHPFFKLVCASFPDQPKKTRMNNLQKYDIEIEGAVKEGVIDCTAHFDSLRKKKDLFVPHRISFTFEKLMFVFPNQTHAGVSCKRTTLLYRSEKTVQRVYLGDSHFNLSLKGGCYRNFTIHSSLYEGYLKGEGTVDISGFPFKSSFRLDIQDVNIQQASSFVTDLYQVYGKANGTLFFRSFPQIQFWGNVEAKDGILDNVCFFIWLADFFRIPSLKKVPFSTLSLNFMITEDVASLNNIRLISTPLALDGYFHLYKSNLVSGIFSLGFSRRLLSESSKFRTLLRLLETKESSVEFEFKLSGLFETMNFKWLASDFKQKLEDLLSRNMERKIEKSIEEVIESISVQ